MERPTVASGACEQKTARRSVCDHNGGYRTRACRPVILAAREYRNNRGCLAGLCMAAVLRAYTDVPGNTPPVQYDCVLPHTSAHFMAGRVLCGARGTRTTACSTASSAPHLPHPLCHARAPNKRLLTEAGFFGWITRPDTSAEFRGGPCAHMHATKPTLVEKYLPFMYAGTHLPVGAQDRGPESSCLRCRFQIAGGRSASSSWGDPPAVPPDLDLSRKCVLRSAAWRASGVSANFRCVTCSKPLGSVFVVNFMLISVRLGFRLRVPRRPRPAFVPHFSPRP